MPGLDYYAWPANKNVKPRFVIEYIRYIHIIACHVHGTCTYTAVLINNVCPSAITTGEEFICLNLTLIWIIKGRDDTHLLFYHVDSQLFSVDTLVLTSIGSTLLLSLW